MENLRKDIITSHSVFIDCIPPRSTAQASQRILKRHDGTQFIGRFSKGKAAIIKSELFALFYNSRPENPIPPPIQFECHVIYPWRSAETKKNKKLWSGLMPCDKKPDFDNLSKLITDSLTSCKYWINDAQIADGRILKFWGDKPGIYLLAKQIVPVSGVASNLHW